LWNDIWLEKVSITLSSGINSPFRESKDRKTPLIWLFALWMELLIFCCYLKAIYSKERQWSWERDAYLLLRSDWIAWFWGSIDICNWCKPLNLQRCRWIRIRPAMASISIVSEVWNTPRIHSAALCCNLLSSLSR